MDVGRARSARRSSPWPASASSPSWQWTRELGVPVMPLSTGEEVATQVSRLLGAALSRGGAERADARARPHAASPRGGPEGHRAARARGLAAPDRRAGTSCSRCSWPSRFWAYSRYRRRRAANLYRRQALAELDALVAALGAKGGRHQVAARLPELLKRVALHVEPRAAVAGLSGAEWLAELDRLYGGDGFTQGPGPPPAQARLRHHHFRLGRAPGRHRRPDAPEPRMDREASEAGGMSDLLARAAKALSFPMGASTPGARRALGAPARSRCPCCVYRALPAYKERQPALRVPFFERVAAGLGRKPEPGAVVLRKARSAVAAGARSSSCCSWRRRPGPSSCCRPSRRRSPPATCCWPWTSRAR